MAKRIMRIKGTHRSHVSGKRFGRVWQQRQYDNVVDDEMRQLENKLKAERIRDGVAERK